MKNILKIMHNIIYMLVYGCFYQYIIYTSWNWFIAPKFNLPTLNFTDSIGVFFIPSFFCIDLVGNYEHQQNIKKITDQDEKDRENYDFKFAKVLIVLPIWLFLAWTVHKSYLK